MDEHSNLKNNASPFRFFIGPSLFPRFWMALDLASSTQQAPRDDFCMQRQTFDSVCVDAAVRIVPAAWSQGRSAAVTGGNLGAQFLR
jgi:hypothetical protein